MGKVYPNGYGYGEIFLTVTGTENDGVKVAAAAAAEVVLQGGGATGNGDEVSELMGAEEEAAASACEVEGNDDEECVQRRLLRDAHLDYIYTQRRPTKP
uniref:Phytosulfokine n=1 Tax=Oryza brachyantha TaxID=4533 RepID=J3NBD6_ORYBR